MNEPLLDLVASKLRVTSDELLGQLKHEFYTITSNKREAARYPSDLEAFLQFGLNALFNLDDECIEILRKLWGHDEDRKLYFTRNEVQAVARILAVLEKPQYSPDLFLSNLQLYQLPRLLLKTTRLRLLDISHNNLDDISMLGVLSELEILIADHNVITEIPDLRHAGKLRELKLNHNRIVRAATTLLEVPSLKVLELANNRIDTPHAKTIVETTWVQKIKLEGNPIDVDPAILNNIEELKDYFHNPLPDEIYTDWPEAQSAAKSTAPDKNKDFEQSADPVLPTEQPTTTEQFLSSAIRDIRLRGNPDKVLLDIEKLAPIFYDLISNSDRNGEHFFGLFGRWGRGKTFFWKYLRQNILNRDKYIDIEFHAWKYQDTPGIWAYLYNTLNDAYLGDKPKPWQVKQSFHYFWKLLKLNSLRGKLTTIAVSLLGIGLAIIGYFYNQEVRGEDIVSKFLRIGIPVSVFSLLMYMSKTFKTDARKIISSLTTNVNFNSQLGFQHEIQHELKCLLKAWIPNRAVGSRRIFLFIDDIDRCSEDKIIQIVDYIRVLLHCEAIQDRVTVLAAIDERILLHAIQEKYKRFIENKDNDATYKELCREYMDKLFLAGLKLGPLTEFEKRQIVEGFTDSETSNEEVWVQYDKQGIDSQVVSEVLQQTQETDEAVKTVEALIQNADNKVVIPEELEPVSTNGTVQEAQKTAIRVESQPIASTARKEFPYEKWEQDFIKDILARNTESTPRSIRVYTYRYLLGKQLVEKALREGKASWKQWYNTKEAKQCFAIKLLHYGFKSDTDHLLADYKKFISDYEEDRQVPTSIYGYEVSLNQELGSIMYQVLTMIIAY